MAEVVGSKPKTIPEYKKWLVSFHSVETGELKEARYDLVASKILDEIEHSPIWQQLIHDLPEFGDSYKAQHDLDLLTTPGSIKLQTKPFSSFLEKTFRKNVLRNSCWPDPPKKGWLLPVNWYTDINDIVRTLITVKYLDGVEFVIQSISKLCKAKQAHCHFHLEAKTEGYYAAHIYVSCECEIPLLKWDTTRIPAFLEIQVTTQLQEVIRTLLHKYYEERRFLPPPNSNEWQWNYRTPEFAANYLGHILHYVEGMIMDIREKQRKDLS